MTAASLVGDLEEVGDALLGHFVDRCRDEGFSWSQISTALGVSRQAAHKRFAPSGTPSRLSGGSSTRASGGESEHGDDFAVACVAAIGEVQRLGFMPGGWIGLIDQLGAAEAARQLLRRDPALPVFHFLVGIGRPELCVEGMVVQPKWASLFNDAERKIARTRLQMAGVTEL